jgi:DNA-binding response OmpR family regulator
MNTEQMNPPIILIVEDDDLQYEIYEEALAKYKLVRVKNGSDAMALIPRQPPDAIILDHVLSEGELGLDFLPEFKELLPHVPIIIVSGALEVRQQMAALQGPRRAHYCLPKPVDIHDLRRTVKTALKECGETEVVRQFEALEHSRRVDALELFSRSSDRLTRQNRLHPRPAGIDPPRRAQAGSLSRMGESDGGGGLNLATAGRDGNVWSWLKLENVFAIKRYELLEVERCWRNRVLKLASIPSREAAQRCSIGLRSDE